jgi:hypothetical protein
MRGRAQAHLIEASDGEFYVLKSTNNPQHRRTLINEWLSCAFLRHLDIFVPETRLIEITPEFAAKQADFSLGSRHASIPPGIHFGSRLAVNPTQTAIFDFLPDRLLSQLENRQDFLGALVFDTWVGNSDARQAVFFRTRRKKEPDLTTTQPDPTDLWAQMIDHGHAFDGPNWCYQDSACQGLYFRTSVYVDVQSIDSFGPWLERVNNFPHEIVETARKEIPEEWIQGDGHELERLLDRLLQRRSCVPDLISQVHRNRPLAFANWPRFYPITSNNDVYPYSVER